MVFPHHGNKRMVKKELLTEDDLLEERDLRMVLVYDNYVSSPP
jgi:hypothetical protein